MDQPTVGAEHQAYVLAWEQAQLHAHSLKGRRVQWKPFGREPARPYVGTITRVELSGVMVKWDDESFWDSTRPHALHPDDLAFVR